MSPLREEIKLVKPFPSLEAEVFLTLLRTHEEILAAFSAVLKRSNISEPQYNALRILRGAGEAGLPSLEIAERMVTRAPDITRLIDRLEEGGLVRRKRSDADRRVVRVGITAAGLDLLASLDDPVNEEHIRQFAHMSRDDLVQLRELLEKVRTPPCE